MLKLAPWAEQGEQRQRRPAPDFVRAHRPAAVDRRERRDGGEGQRHPAEQRQGAAHEAAVGPREDEGENWQDARADDGQDAAEIGEQDHQRVWSGSGWNA